MPEAKKTVLIIEDEPEIRTILETMLADAEFGVLVAPEAKTGLRLAIEKHPDLILLDVIMPEMDGLTMLQTLRQDAWGKNVPVIVLSNLDDPDSVAIAVQNHVAGYIAKTNLVPETIIKEVRGALGM